MTTTATTETTQKTVPTTQATTQPIPEAAHLTVSSPGAVEPGFTSQLFVVAEAALRITDVQAHGGCEAVRLIAGSSDTAPDEGVSWADHLKMYEDVRVERGQYITVIGRNVANAKQRIRASVRTLPVAGSVSAKTSAPKPFKVAIARGPLPVPEPGAPVRFVLERGYAPYALAFVRDATPVPRSVRGALVSSFDSHHAVRKEGDAPLPRTASAVEVMLPAVLREKVGFSIRSMLPLQLHADDRRTVVEAIEDALTGGEQASKPASQQAGKPAEEQAGKPVSLAGLPGSRPADWQEENTLMRNSILALEKRVADLEAALKGQIDPPDSSLLPDAGLPAPGSSS